MVKEIFSNLFVNIVLPTILSVCKSLLNIAANGTGVYEVAVFCGTSA